MNGRIRPSSLGKWATCPKKAYAALSGADEAAVPSVAEWIGSCAHARIADRVEPDLPRGYTFWDSITPNLSVAQHQIATIAGTVYEYLTRNGYTVYGSELSVESDWVEGTLDLLVKKDVSDTLAIVDVKTGQRVPLGVWHQLGAYVDAYNKYRELHVEEILVLHVPRTSLSEDQKVNDYIRPAKGCAEAAMVLVRQVDDWANVCTLDTIPAMPGSAVRRAS